MSQPVITVEKDIGRPARPTLHEQYGAALISMDFGDSFFIPEITSRDQWLRSLMAHAKTRYSILLEPLDVDEDEVYLAAGVRVWRVAQLDVKSRRAPAADDDLPDGQMPEGAVGHDRYFWLWECMSAWKLEAGLPFPSEHHAELSIQISQDKYEHLAALVADDTTEVTDNQVRAILAGEPREQHTEVQVNQEYASQAAAVKEALTQVEKAFGNPAKRFWMLAHDNLKPIFWTSTKPLDQQGICEEAQRHAIEITEEQYDRVACAPSEPIVTWWVDREHSSYACDVEGVSPRADYSGWTEVDFDGYREHYMLFSAGVKVGASGQYYLKHKETGTCRRLRVGRGAIDSTQLALHEPSNKAEYIAWEADNEL